VAEGVPVSLAQRTQLSVTDLANASGSTQDDRFHHPVGFVALCGAPSRRIPVRTVDRRDAVAELTL